MTDTYTVLGDRAPTPCDIGDAHGVAMVVNEPVCNLTSTPFRHPPLLDNEVRVDVQSCGLCSGDVGFATQAHGPFSVYPMVIGHELFGVVSTVGEKVSKWEVGDRVGLGFWRGRCLSCEFCLSAKDNLCPKRQMTIMPNWGGLATSFQAKESDFVRVPDQLPITAAPLTCAGATVYHALAENARPGMSVGVVGIGGLGHLAIQYAKVMGCEVTAFSSTFNKEEEARNFGAHHFVNLGDADSRTKAARSVDLILETGSVLDIKNDSQFVKPGGGMMLLGDPKN